MKFKAIRNYFNFSKDQQKGILSLFFVIIALQLVYYFVDFTSPSKVNPEKQKWLSLESQIDSMENSSGKEVPKIYPFNPNFITDYKGYKLGMSVVELDRLHAFRKENKYVNSAKEFQVVTGVSDSFLKVISPYFKFPDWVKNKPMFKLVAFSNTNTEVFSKKEKIVVKDINQATQEDLIKINGIGEAISMRILKFKESLGGFVSMEQMKDVWGLSPEVVQCLNAGFKVGSLSNIKKIDINNASVKELAQFPYFKYNLAREIVIYRSMNGDIKNAADLTKIKGMSVENANIIALYLDF
ncbi:helix-hairpin-helix domain-containing protein [Flavobacterium sufflavum]|uniref:Helix-hairpin-helix domain-containing protein n=1 Tax=Flavobacterium sufflavum TaxID=1921138 RepID=A0A437KYK0_9FLAO|nr:helix-hairpin-helix domain-containing protein [Flavobacterium sufflavum]RVT77670.1 helix-hairpin-helix domain-containing protein [Flavobacterium sufflavum]